ncbi:MAG: MFS transporter [Planctomycetes bacterium]|nr:MFS transporter [Planctomycetota bacterium]
MTLSLLAAATLLGAVVVGLIPAAVNSVQKSIQTRHQLSEGHVAWFVRRFHIAWLPTMPLAGWMLDTWHNKPILFLGLVSLILGLAWLALIRTTRALAANGFFLGIGYSVVAVAVIRFMPVAFFSDHNVTLAAINLGFVAVGFGALAGPYVIRLIETWSGYRQGLLYLSIALIIPAGLVAWCDADQFPPPDNPMPWGETFSRTHLILLMAALLIYFAIEAFLALWAESYLKEVGNSDRGVQLNLLAFGAAFIAMRGLAAWWLYWHPGHGFVLTLVLAVVAAGCLVNLTARFAVGGVFGFWLVGAAFGPLLPCILGIAMQKPFSTGGLGILLALNAVDVLLVSLGMNLLGKDRPIRSVMWAPTAMALVLWVPLLLTALLRA